MMLAMFGGGIGFQEVLVIAVVAVLLFGSRLPQVARSLGQSYQQFRKGLADLQSSIHMDDDPPVNRYRGGLPDYSDRYEPESDTPAPFEEPPAEDR